MAVKLCDSCKSAMATLFCRADSAFLCIPCDTKVHLANKLASRHARVWICEVCEQAPASVTCKADAAALCATCDHDIHSANPLARRHERFPVVPFYEPAATAPKYSSESGGDEEAEVASWILPNPVNKVMDLFSDVDPYLDLDLISDHQNQQADCLVPAVVDGVPCFDVVDYSGSKPYLYNFNTQTITPTLSSSSSMEVGVVPEHDVSTSSLPIQALSGVDREARVMRYREKRKNRKFEKTIRYASRKAYAETRPRVKGRFAKRTTVEDGGFSPSAMADGGYGVVPSF